MIYIPYRKNLLASHLTLSYLRKGSFENRETNDMVILRLFVSRLSVLVTLQL